MVWRRLGFPPVQIMIGGHGPAKLGPALTYRYISIRSCSLLCMHNKAMHCSAGPNLDSGPDATGGLVEFLLRDFLLSRGLFVLPILPATLEPVFVLLPGGHGSSLEGLCLL